MEEEGYLYGMAMMADPRHDFGLGHTWPYVTDEFKQDIVDKVSYIARCFDCFNADPILEFIFDGWKGEPIDGNTQWFRTIGAIYILMQAFVSVWTHSDLPEVCWPLELRKHLVTVRRGLHLLQIEMERRILSR